MTKYEITPCPVCRSSKHRVLADRDSLKHELEALWQFHLRRLRTGAPVEQLFDRAIFSQNPPLQVVACRDCGLVFRNPREREEEVLETYQQEEPSQEAFASLFEQQREFYKPRADKLTHLAGRPGSVLEVGSYVGGFLRAAEDAGWRARGIDVNASANRFARQQGCSVDQSALHEFDSKEKFDAVALWNLFDQLPDPHAALQHVNQLVTGAGLIAIRVPNGAFYASARRYRRFPGRAMLAWNNLASFPYRHGFTAESLNRLLSEYGYEIVAREADTLVSIASAYTRPWARWEERIIKGFMRVALPFKSAPWLEVYARRRATSTGSPSDY
jgi:SAM-dependent methyltransferase